VADLTHLMFWAVLGHFIGDYLLQNKWMLSKSEKGTWGALVCIIHSFIYSLAVTLVVSLYFYGSLLNSLRGPLVLTMVFLTHYPIDRWSLATKWLKWIKGRRLDRFDDMYQESYSGYLSRVSNVSNIATQQAFAAIVYTIADNTTHILLMIAGFATLLYYGMLP